MVSPLYIPIRRNVSDKDVIMDKPKSKQAVIEDLLTELDDDIEFAIRKMAGDNIFTFTIDQLILLHIARSLKNLEKKKK